MFSDLKKAENCFQKGMVFSLTINRPVFWIVHLGSLAELLKHNDSFINSTTPVTDAVGVYSTLSLRFLYPGKARIGYFEYNR